MKGLFVILFLWFAASPCLGRRRHPVNPTFNVLDYGAIGNGKADDSQAFLKAWKDVCGAKQGSPTLLIPKRKIFMLQPVDFCGPCKSPTINIKIEGKIIGPEIVSDWKWEGDHENKWIYFSNIKGLLVNGGGVIDGRGAPWWDCHYHYQYTCKKRPNSAMCFHKCDDLQLDRLTHKNSPRAHISINECNRTHISNLHIFAPEHSPNTDGIDISRTSNMVIQDSYIGTGDDCIAINEGSSHFNITGINCGPGHGISIGSLGSKGSHATVEEIHVRNCTFTGTLNGARIKTWQGGSGYARKITFEDITLVEAKNPVIINQEYVGQKEAAATTVKVSDITYRNFHGTSANEDAIQLNCDRDLGCSGIVLDRIKITSSDLEKKTYASCVNAHGTSSSSNVPEIDCLQR